MKQQFTTKMNFVFANQFYLLTANSNTTFITTKSLPTTGIPNEHIQY
jgi:hypothetical protein